MEDLATYLRQVRDSTDLDQLDLARYIHRVHPGLAVSSLHINYIGSFEKGYNELRYAIKGKEPARSIFLMYINLLNPNQKQRKEIKRLVRKYNPDFKFDGVGIVLSPAQKLMVLPRRAKIQVEDLIENLYDKHVLKKTPK